MQLKRKQKIFLGLALAAGFLFTSIHAIGHTHSDGRIHHDCNQYLFLQQFSAETADVNASIVITLHVEAFIVNQYSADIKSHITYGTMYPNAPPVNSSVFPEN